MSRIRSIHPGFFSDEDLVSVSLAARLLFIGIGIEADDKGIFEWKPLTIKMRVFPADNIDVAAALAELEAVNAIRSFSVSGKSFGAIKNFRKFQRPKTPNDIHPISPELRIYVGLDPGISEPFPPKGEKPPQMEEGGDKREESVVVGADASASAPEALPANLDSAVPPDLSDMQTLAAECARIACTRQIDPMQFGRDITLCREWTIAGGDPEIILEQIREGVASATEPISSLKFFDRRIRTAIAKREALKNGTPASTAKQPSATDEITQRALDRMAARRASGEIGGVVLLG